MPPDDRVVLITGASGNLGPVVAAAFAELGAKVVLAGSDRDRLTALALRLGLPDDQWLAVTGNLRAPDEAADAVAVALERFGRIDVLVHLVGGWVGGTPVAELDHDELRTMLDLHLWSTLNVVQAVVPGMVERGWGRILAVSTPFVATPGPRGASYAIGKAAEETLLRTLAREVGGSGVTVNLVVVRSIEPRHEPGQPPAARTASTPEEITAALVFLASPEAAGINGARVPLDGR